MPEVVTKFTAVCANTLPGSFILCGEMGPGGCYGGSCVIRSEIKDAEAAVAIHPEGWAVVIADFEGIDTLPFVLPSPFPTPPPSPCSCFTSLHAQFDQPYEIPVNAV